MKRFVDKPWMLSIVVAMLTLVVAAVTGAEEDGMLLIGVGFIAIVFSVQRIVDTRA